MGQLCENIVLVCVLHSLQLFPANNSNIENVFLLSGDLYFALTDKHKSTWTEQYILKMKHSYVSWFWRWSNTVIVYWGILCTCWQSLNLRCVLPRNTLFESTKSVLNVTAISNWSQIIMYRVRTISVTEQNKLSAKMVLWSKNSIDCAMGLFITHNPFFQHLKCWLTLLDPLYPI